MSSQDLFFTLIGGTKFDKKRFQKDIIPFQGGARSEDSFGTKKSDLDFFKSARKISSTSTTVSDQQDEVEDETENKEEEEEANNEEEAENDSDDNEEETEKSKGKKKLITQNQLIKEMKKLEFDANKLRGTHRIHVKGSDVPPPFSSFEELKERGDIRKYLYENIVASNFTAPTPIQMQAIPIMIKRRDLVALAPTGSGKTLSYIVPILSILKKPKKEGFRSLVLCPTRELAVQIHAQFVKFAKGKDFRIHVLSKVKSNTHQYNETSQRLDVLISTPLKLIYLIQRNAINLSTVQVLVLDEADKLFDLGFVKQIDEIFAACTNRKKQVAFFSATISSSVLSLAQTVMNDSLSLRIGSEASAAETIKQKLIYTGTEEGKIIAFRQLISEGMKPPILVFVQSRERALSLFRELVYDGITVDIITADRTLPQRDAIVRNFRTGKLWVLISTDLMGRGMDFKGINYIINYDFPQSSAQYIHRIGRTGRAGRIGESITFFNDEDIPFLRNIAAIVRNSGCEVPGWIFNLPLADTTMKKQLKMKPVERQDIGSSSSNAPQTQDKKRKFSKAEKSSNKAKKTLKSDSPSKNSKTPQQDTQPNQPKKKKNKKKSSKKKTSPPPQGNPKKKPNQKSHQAKK